MSYTLIQNALMIPSVLSCGLSLVVSSSTGPRVTTKRLISTNVWIGKTLHATLVLLICLALQDSVLLIQVVFG